MFNLIKVNVQQNISFLLDLDPFYVLSRDIHGVDSSATQ